MAGLSGGVVRSLDVAEERGNRALNDFGQLSRSRLEQTRTSMRQSVDYVATRWGDLSSELPLFKDEAPLTEPRENEDEPSEN